MSRHDHDESGRQISASGAAPRRRSSVRAACRRPRCSGRDGVDGRRRMPRLHALLRCRAGASRGGTRRCIFPGVVERLGAQLAELADSIRRGASPCGAPTAATSPRACSSRTSARSARRSSWPGRGPHGERAELAARPKSSRQIANSKHSSTVAAHDLRGPLRILNGFAEALDDECGADAQRGRRDLSQGDPQGQRAHGGLIDGLLTSRAPAARR